MEKFGIFNLLSALSSLAAKPAEAEPAKREEPPAPSPDAETAPAAGVFTAEERKTRAAAMLERHEQISRRIRRR